MKPASNSKACNKVLIADSDRLACELMQFNLEEQGYNVDTVRDVDMAYDKKLTDYCLFIIDATMDNLAGTRLAHYLKQNNATANIPLIFCSARDREHDVIGALDSGADDYLLKPFAVREMMARINAIMRRYMRNRPA